LEEARVLKAGRVGLLEVDDEVEGSFWVGCCCCCCWVVDDDIVDEGSDGLKGWRRKGGCELVGLKLERYFFIAEESLVVVVVIAVVVVRVA
jgi:hypothetical protein